MHLGSELDWPVFGDAAALTDGPYSVGIRPHHVSPVPPSSGTQTIEITGEVRITELSGSESVAHFELGQHTWVSQAPGVHPYRVGEEHRFFMVPGQCYYFGADGSLAAKGVAHG